MSRNPRTLFNHPAYLWVYDLIRKNKVTNHIAHKLMQSEWLNRFPPYEALYRRVIRQKSAVLIRVPQLLEFELTDACNARCIMCPPEVHMGRTFVDHELFLRVTREAYDIGIRKMNLTGGEPLLDKKIFEKIKFAKKIGFDYVHMFSNGSLLNADKQEQILDSGLDSFTMSVDSAIESEYEKIRRRLKFQTVVGNMKQFHALRKSKNMTKPLIRINMVALPENKNSRKAFLDTFKPYGDMVEIMDSHNYAGGINEDISAREYSQTKRHPCHLLFNKAVINPFGFLKKCSIDHSSLAQISDMSKVSLKDALYSERFMSVKNEMLNYNFNEPGCDICTHKESWWVDH